MNFQVFSLQLETPAQMFSCKFCEIFDNVFTIKPFMDPRHPRKNSYPRNPLYFLTYTTRVIHANFRPPPLMHPRDPQAHATQLI